VTEPVPAPTPPTVQIHTLPRGSSDYGLAAVHAADGHMSGIYAVTDLIGHPIMLRFGKYMTAVQRDFQELLRRAPPGDLDALTTAVAREIAARNARIRELRAVKSRGAFGFCLCLAVVCDDACRIFQLGDARAYALRRRADPGGTPGVVPLTSDQNQIQRLLVERRGEMVLFRNELVELSKQLECYWGHPDDATVRRTLEVAAAAPPLPLPAGDALLMMTDGLYLPLVRRRMDATNFRLTPEDYYLAPWFAEWFAARAADAAPPDWTALKDDLLRDTETWCRRKPRYRDDIAVLLLTRS